MEKKYVVKIGNRNWIWMSSPVVLTDKKKEALKMSLGVAQKMKNKASKFYRTVEVEEYAED